MTTDLGVLLRQVLSQHGDGLLYDRSRLQALLNDYDPSRLSERKLIGIGVEAGVAQALATRRGTRLTLVERQSLVRQMMTHQFIGENFAAWTVDVWAFALDRAAQQTTEKPIFPRLTFKALPPVEPGGFPTLSWSTDGAEKVELLPEPGEVGPEGTYYIAPLRTTKYTLRAETAGLSVQESVDVDVQAKAHAYPHLKARISPLLCFGLGLVIAALLTYLAFRTRHPGQQEEITLTARPLELDRPGVVTVVWSGPVGASASLEPAGLCGKDPRDWVCEVRKTTTFTLSVRQKQEPVIASRSITVKVRTEP